MTRRGFFAAVVPGLGAIVPVSGAFINCEHGRCNEHGRDSSRGFILTGHFTQAGEDPRSAYFALGQGLTLVIDPERLPACANGAQALIGLEATISLTQA